MNRRAILSLEPVDVLGFALLDGGWTRDRAVALRDRMHRASVGDTEVRDVVRALYRVDLALDPGRPTPARIEFARELVTTFVLPEAVLGVLDTLERLDDEAWAPIGELVRRVLPSEQTISCWAVRLVADDGVPLTLPIDFDPLDYVDCDPPAAAVGSVLVALEALGWGVDSVEIDRDDEDDDFVDAMRWRLSARGLALR